MSNIAMGATGLALAAGAVATGIALANKDTRRKLQKTAKKTAQKATTGIKRAREMMEESQQKYQAFQHRVAKVKPSRGLKKIALGLGRKKG